MKAKKETGFLLKDHLFNKQKVRFLANLFRGADDQFDADRFVRQSIKPFQQLELKERIVHIASTLEKHLDSDFRVAAKQILRALPPPLDPQKTDDDFGDFIFAPLGEYVVRNGMASRHVKLSLRTLKALTQRFSMEDAIRRFINTHTELTLAELNRWSTDKNYHVRRLVSEGTRPSLPWSGRLSIDVERPLPLLDTLHADPTRYVTRSIANHLNDISKKKPELTLGALRRWKKQGDQTSHELNWISKHSLRTLVKQGHSGALRFLGYRPEPKIEVDSLAIASDRIKPGQAIEFSFTITAHRNESLIIDYVVEFVKANGRLAPKVYKINQLALQKGESVTIKKRHVLRANATTYTLYPGTHRVTIQINGKSYESKSFELR